ncbi:MAG: radical SAM protein [Nanoarchaeota archaeon]
MKIALLQPRGPLYKNKTGTFKKTLMYAPLTLTTLAALVPPELNAEIKIIDEGVEDIDSNLEADLVAITAITGTSRRAYKFADKFRARGIPVVMGGVHATLVPNEVVEHADAVVVGYAEENWPQLIRDFKEGKMKKFYYQSPNHSLANMPFPRRDMLKKNGYTTIYSIEAARGCLNNCDFCVVPAAWGRKLYQKSVENVIAEIRHMKAKHLIFLDLSPTEDVDYAKRLYSAMIPLKLKWFGLSTTKIYFDNELLELAAKSGCKGLLIGFESVDQTTLKNANKGFNNVSKYYDLVEKLHSHGIAINGCFVFGFDNDDKDTFKKTVEFVQKANIDLPRYAIYTPFPNTMIHNKLRSEGRIIEDNWSLYDAQHCVFQPAQMTPQELEEGARWAWRETYKLKSIFKRLAGARCLTRITLPLNLAYRHYAYNLHNYTKDRMLEDLDV